MKLFILALAATLSSATAADCADTTGLVANPAPCTCPITDDSTLADADTEDCTAETGLFCRAGATFTMAGQTGDDHMDAMCGTAALHPVHCPEQNGKVKNAHDCICTSRWGVTKDCTANQYCRSSDKALALAADTDDAKCSATVIPTDCLDSTGKVKNVDACVCTSVWGSTKDCTANQFCKSSEQIYDILGDGHDAKCSASAIHCADTTGLVENSAPCTCPITDDSTLANAYDEDCTAETGLFCRAGATYTLAGQTGDGHQDAMCGAAALHPVHCPEQNGKVKNVHECICTSRWGSTKECTANQFCKSSEQILDILGDTDDAKCSASEISAAASQQLPFAAAVFGAAVMVMYQAL